MKRLYLTICLLILPIVKFYGQDKTGIYTGINLGTWIPDGKNRLLGNPLMFGFTVDFKFPKNSFALNFDLIFGLTTKEPLHTKHGDSILTVNKYGGADITLDYCRELFETENFIFEIMAGLGYGNLSYYNSNYDSDISKGSFVFSPGVSIRYLFDKQRFLGGDMFMQLKMQYHIANYDLNDDVSTDLTGNYLLLKLIIGGR